MKIAVVGAGISGSSVIKTILSHSNFTKEDTIEVFETRELLGVGFPYDDDDNSVMLNVSPEILSFDQSNPNDFIEWLYENYEEPFNFEDLVSRPQYGRYLAERFAPYFNHPQVIHHSLEVIDIKVLNAKTKEEMDDSKSESYIFQLKTTEGWEDTIYDAVFFSIGHPPYADYYDLIDVENYIHNPYPMKEVLGNLTGEEKIGVIGSGATGVDLMRFLMTNYELKEPLTYYVPSGEIFNFPNIPLEREDFQFTFSMDWIEAEKDEHTGNIDLEKLIKTFIEDIKQGSVDVKKVYDRYKADNLEAMRSALESNDQELALIHSYAAKLVGYLPYLFNALSGEDKQRYLKKYHKKLLFFKARVPNKTFKWLFELLDAGKVKLVEGISRVEPQEDGTFIVVADETETADILINATGFDTSLENVSKHSPLIKNLYHQEFILPHTQGRFILVDWPQTQVMNQRFGLMKNVFFFGILIGGTQHENNDAQLTIRQATYSAKWFMENRHI